MLTATAPAWAGGLVHPSYGTDDTYRLAAAWLEGCPDVADWGGGLGHFASFLPATTRYTLVDGTSHRDGTVVADLRQYRRQASGILLRHVLEHNDEWETILRQAVQACRQRLCVVTFTPDRGRTERIKVKSGWPVWSLAPVDVRTVLGAGLIRDEACETSHPEHVYYWARP